MRAVLPEPTGLWGVEGVGSVGVFFLRVCAMNWSGVCVSGVWRRWSVRMSLPTDSYGEGALAPVSAGYYGHLALCVGARAVEYLVRVAVFGRIEFVGVGG